MIDNENETAELLSLCGLWEVITFRIPDASLKRKRVSHTRYSFSFLWSIRDSVSHRIIRGRTWLSYEQSGQKESTQKIYFLACFCFWPFGDSRPTRKAMLSEWMLVANTIFIWHDNTNLKLCTCFSLYIRFLLSYFIFCP